MVQERLGGPDHTGNGIESTVDGLEAYREIDSPGTRRILRELGDAAVAEWCRGRVERNPPSRSL